MPEYVEIACLGDSIANGFFDETGKGWVMRLVEKLNTPKPYGYYLNNFARSGDKSCDAFHKLCSSVVSMRPDVLLIAVGTNDLIRWDKPDGPTNTDKGFQEEYWSRIFDIAKKNVPNIFVSGLIPCDESQMPRTGLADRILWKRNSDIIEYNVFLEKICHEHNLPFISFYNEFEKASEGSFFYDGSHPNTEGHEWMAEFAFERLKNLI